MITKDKLSILAELSQKSKEANGLFLEEGAQEEQKHFLEGVEKRKLETKA